jgi:hypothetical protein
MVMYLDMNIRSNPDREPNDYYATDPKALEKLLKYESFDKNIWEPACGEGNLSKVLKDIKKFIQSGHRYAYMFLQSV